MTPEQPLSRRSARDRARDDAQNTVRGRLVDVSFVVALLIIAMIPLWPIYQHPTIIRLCVVSLLVAGLIAFGARAAKFPAYAVAATTVVAYIAIGVPLAVPTEAQAGFLPTLGGLRDLLFGTTSSWREALTAQIPFGTYQALAVPALIVVLTCSVAGISVALQAKRPAWAVIAPVVMLAFGISFGSADTLWPLGAGVALFIGAMAWVTVRAGRSQPGRSGWRRASAVARRYSAAFAVVAVCAAGACAVVSLNPLSTDRHVLRTNVTPPFQPRDLISPLVGYRNDVLPPGADAELFTVTGLPSGARIRLATLDTYNGMVYAVGEGPASSGSFERVPYKVQSDNSKGTRVQVKFTIGDYSDVWVPTVGDLTSIHFDAAHKELSDSFFYNKTTSSAAIRPGLEKGASYTVDARVTKALTEEQLAKVRPATTRQSPKPDIPQDLIDAVKEHSGTGTTPGARLVSLAQWLRTGYVSHSGADEPFSRPGHSADRLRVLLTEAPMLGDAEQYAPTMALFARQLGFPSRVVLGYAPADGQTTITGADTTAWAEVQIADGSWVMVDPNPEVREVPKIEDPTTQRIARPKTILPPPPETTDDSVTTRSQDDDGPEDEPRGAGWTAVLLAVLRVGGLGIGIIGIVTSPLWVLALAATIRRFFRRRADRRTVAVTGAWDEVRDALLDRGQDIEPAATRAEVAELADSPEVQDLADRADEGAFSANPLTSAQVDAYWADAKKIRHRLDTGISKRERLRTALSTRSLRRSLAAGILPVAWRQRLPWLDRVPGVTVLWREGRPTAEVAAGRPREKVSVGSSNDDGGGG